jgi:hypothetical protein
MNRLKRLKRVQERHFSAHHLLLNTAWGARERAIKKQPGWRGDALVVMLCSAMAIEAMCNTIGERVVDEWKEDYESSKPDAKIRILAAALKVDYQRDKEPWKTARWLFTFRNKVAHAKPERIVEEEILTQKQHDRRLFDTPQSKLERDITVPNATRALDAARKVLDRLASNMQPDDTVGILVDIWTGTTQAHSE